MVIRDGMDASEKRKISSHCWDRNHSSTVLQAVA